MDAFDKIIGYSSIKEELRQIGDTLKHREFYDKLGVRTPRGLLLCGEPGVGKSLMANALIRDSGRRAFCCRKDVPGGDFVKKIKKVFDAALQNEPSVVCLEDMDKFSDTDEFHPDTEEYVTVQSCLDQVREKQIFVLATVNSIRSLPPSLCRAGRFDRVIVVKPPRGQDAVGIAAHYLQAKSHMDRLDPQVIAKIMDGKSCAELEAVINQAGLYAGYERADRISMEHVLRACAQTLFNTTAQARDGQEDISLSRCQTITAPAQLIYHEAGHAAVSEVLCPGSVTLVYANTAGGEQDGFTRYYQDKDTPPLYWQKSRIICSLGGAAAVDQKFGLFDPGCRQDLNQAFAQARNLIVNICIHGFSLHGNGFNDSQQLAARQETAIAAEIEMCYKKAKEILALNRDFFQQLAAALAEQRLISVTDIQALREKCGIVPIAL